MLDADNAAFVAGPVSIIAAGRDAHNVPCAMRACGARLSADRSRMTILLPTSRSAELLANLEANGAIAVVLTRPTTHRSMQLKGTDAKIAAPARADAALVRGYVDAMVAEIGSLGHPTALVRVMIPADVADLTAVTFTIAAAYTQTPGPRAGALLPR